MSILWTAINKETKAKIIMQDLFPVILIGAIALTSQWLPHVFNFVRRKDVHKMHQYHKRCSPCGRLFGCIHVNKNLIRTRHKQTDRDPNMSLSTLQIGEDLPDAMESFSGVVINNPLKLLGKEVKLADNAEAPTIVQEQSDWLAEHLKSLTPNQSSKDEIKKTKRVLILPPSITITNSSDNEDTITCSLCNGIININGLDLHMKAHVISQTATTPSIDRYRSRVAISSSSNAIIVRDQKKEEPTLDKQEKKETPKINLRAAEKYNFRKFEDVCCYSNISKSGRYTDFTAVFWQNASTTTHSNITYHGVHTYQSSDWNRLIIHTVYDNIDDYYTLNVQLLKRSSYSSWDTDEAKIPERICFQSELFTEIKRALLFLQVSPHSTYKMFRKLINKDITLLHDEEGKVIASQTAGFDILAQKLKKTSSTNHHSSIYDAENHYEC